MNVVSELCLGGESMAVVTDDEVDAWAVFSSLLDLPADQRALAMAALEGFIERYGSLEFPAKSEVDE